MDETPAMSRSRRASDACSSISSAPPSEASNPPLADPLPNKNQRSLISTARPASDMDQAPQNVVLGQFSSTPAIQTTVVTTTTTTTTSFPPLLMKAPRHLHTLDPDMYPLAASPTPPSLRKIRFDHNGQTTIFTEAEDAHATHQDVRAWRPRIGEHTIILCTNMAVGVVSKAAKTS